MLSEARARLANTRGKKAKRKAREKGIAEARRLAALQRQRDLRAAGLGSSISHKVRGINYVKEIPFQLKPLPGPYEVPASEMHKSTELEQLLKSGSIPLSALNLPRRDEQFKKFQEEYKEKQKRKEQDSLPREIVEASKQAEVMERARKKSRLILPTPQVTERELQEIAKLEEETEEYEKLVSASEGKATGALLSNYGADVAGVIGGLAAAGATPATPGIAVVGLRTPVARTPMARNTVMDEAQNMLRMERAGTVLGGNNNNNNNGETTEDGTVEFGSMTAHSVQARTPNVLATPGRLATGGSQFSSSSSSLHGTPYRDGLRINTPTAPGGAELDMMGGDKKARKAAERARKKAKAKEFEALLGTIPAPKYKYRIAAPCNLERRKGKNGSKSDNDSSSSDSDRENAIPEDMSEAVENEERRRKQAEERLFGCCSGAMKRGLPRVTSATASGLHAAPGTAADNSEERAVGEELKKIVSYELEHFGVDGTVNIEHAKGDDDITEISEEDMRKASELVAAEMTSEEKELENTEEFSQDWDAAYEDLVFDKNDGSERWVRRSKASSQELSRAARALFAHNKKSYAKEQQKAARLEKRVGLYNGGYQQRALTLRRNIEKAHKQLDQAQTEYNCFSYLRNVERYAVINRVAELSAMVDEQVAIEDKLQERYEELKTKLDSMKNN